MNNSQINKETKSKNKTWLITYLIVGLVLVVGVVLFFYQGQKDEDSFPALTLEPGATLKGQFSNDLSGFWEYAEGDDCVFSTGLDSQTLSSGQNYYYATEDLTIQQIKERINCVPYNKIRIMYLDPISQKFYSWPKAVHNETEELTDPSSVTVNANTTFIIQSKDETFMGEIYDVKTPSPYLPFSPSVNVFDPSGYYGYINDMTSGWVSLAGIADGATMTSDLNNSALANRVEKLFYKNGPGINDFEEIEITGTPIPDIDFSAEEHMIWMRLGEALPELGLGDPLMGCQGDDDTHLCITDGSNPAAFLQTGDDACANCLSIEASCHNLNGGTPNWIPTNESCSSLGQDFLHMGIVNTNNCAFRAVCGLEQAGIIETIDINVNFCESNDEDNNSKCITTTGDDACAAIGSTCQITKAKEHNNSSSEYVNIFQGGGCDKSVDDFYDSLLQGAEWNIRADCSPCSFGDSTYACVTSDQNIQTTAGFWAEKLAIKGDSACEAIGTACSKLQISTNGGTTWSDGLAKEGGGTIECDGFIEEGDQMEVDSNTGKALFPYIIRAECTQ